MLEVASNHNGGVIDISKPIEDDDIVASEGRNAAIIEGKLYHKCIINAKDDI